VTERRFARADWTSWRAAAIGGLALLVGILVLASVLPDPARLDAGALAELEAARPVTLAIARRLPAGRLLSSPWLVSLPLALGLAILWNLGDRIAAWRRGPARAEPARFRAQLEWTAQGPIEAEMARLREVLARGGYRIEAPAGDREAALVGRRGGVGFWGSIAFHVSLVGALVAVVVTLLAEWRGAVDLVEGRPVALDAPGAVAIARRGPLTPPLPHLVLELASAEVRIQGGRFPVEYRAEVVALEPSGALRRGVVRVNDPLAAGGQRLFLQRYGLAPVLEIRRGAEALLAGPVVLSVLEGREDGVDVPGTAARVRIRWFGDAVLEEGGVRSRSDEPRNPALGLALEEPGAAARPVLVRLGEEVSLGPYRVAFRELRRWVELGVGRDPGTPVLFAALALAALGLALRFWDHDREVRVRIAEEGGGLRVAAAGRSRYFPALMRREIDDLRPRP
jgi:cytochrome c biogenesis protein